MSVAGGLHCAVRRAIDAGCDTLQIFTRNNVRWNVPPIGEEEAATFRAAVRDAGLGPVFAHGSYLVNLASDDAAMRRRSETAARAELRRCAGLGLDFLVMHPGAHMGSGETRGLRRVTRSIGRLLEATEGGAGGIALETTAGRGTELGGRLEHIEEILQALDGHARLGVCVDTCHVFAAGYDIASEAGYRGFTRELLRRFRRSRLFAWHLNDSRGSLGSRLDRHAHIGQGGIGRSGFRHLMTDPRFEKIPMVIETPKAPEPEADRRNLGVLRASREARVARGARRAKVDPDRHAADHGAMPTGGSPMMPQVPCCVGRGVRLVAIVFCLSAWTAPQRIEAAPVPSKTTAEEQAAAEAPPDAVPGGETEVEVFGVILLLFVLLMYLWKAR